MRLVVTRDDYFAAALALLAERGHGELKIGLLCTRLGVTTGSFYHYFGSWDAFVDELLRHWELEKTHRLAVTVDAESEPLARVRTIKKMALDLPHDAERAIRAWAHVNDAVATVQSRVDADRLAAIRSVIAPLLGRGRRADRLALMGLSMLVGWQQLRAPVDLKDLTRLLDDYENIVLEHVDAALAG